MAIHVTRVAALVGICWSLLGASPASGQTVSQWRAPAGGDWQDAANWSTDPVAPTTSSYSAVIDAEGAPYEVVSSDLVSLSGLLLDSADATLHVAGGVFSAANGIDIAAGTFKVTGGRIENSRISGDGGVKISNSLTDAVLANVTLAADAAAEFTTSSSTLAFETALRLEDSLFDITGDTRTRFIGGGTIGGNGELRMASSYDHAVEGVWVVEPEATLSLYDTNGRWYGLQGSSRLINRGHLVIEPNAQFRLFTESSSTFGSVRNEGTITIGEGARLSMRVVTQLGEIGTGVGTIEFGPNSALWLGAGPLFYLDEPINVPATAMLELAGSWVNQTQIVVDPGGTLRLHSDGATADMGDIDVRGATVEISDLMTIADLMQLQASNETIFRFDYPDGAIDLQGGTWNLADVTGAWDLRRAAISNGTLTGLGGANQVHLPDSHLSLGDIRLEMPLDITAGNVNLSDASVAHPITVNGGSLSLRNEWTNESEIHVSSGELRLYSVSSQPGTIDMTGGTLYVGFHLNLDQLLALSVGSPDTVAVGATLDLQGGMLDLGSPVQGFQVGGINSGRIRNGTVTDSSGNNPLYIEAGTLGNIEILADVVTGTWASLGGSSVIARRMTFSGNTISATPTTLLLDDVTIDSGIRLGTGTSEVVNGLTVNGSLQLNTTRVQMTGDQTIDGVGEITTSGFRSIPGGGLKMTGGVLTLAEDLTFRSGRRLSVIEATNGGVINRGTITTGIDAYGESNNDLDGPSIIVRADTFEHSGVLVAIEDYDLRVEVDQWANEGTINLQGGGLIAVGTSFRNGQQGQIVGNGRIDVAATDFVNEGLVSPGASAGVLSVSGDSINRRPARSRSRLAAPGPATSSISCTLAERRRSAALCKSHSSTTLSRPPGIRSTSSPPQAGFLACLMSSCCPRSTTISTGP